MQLIDTNWRFEFLKQIYKVLAHKLWERAWKKNVFSLRSQICEDPRLSFQAKTCRASLPTGFVCLSKHWIIYNRISISMCVLIQFESHPNASRSLSICQATYSSSQFKLSIHWSRWRNESVKLNLSPVVSFLSSLPESGNFKPSGLTSISLWFLAPSGCQKEKTRKTTGRLFL